MTTLLVDEGRCQGVVAIEISTGRLLAITAGAVILCTGGCGRVFPFTTNANIKNGDGMALAYRAGAPLKDMEFVQYHPTGLPFTGILITEAARAEGGWMLNKDGYRYLQDYDLGTPQPRPVLRSMELGPRDRLSQAFVKEQEKGRTLKGPYGDYVHLDVRHLGEPLIDRKLPFVRELCRKYAHLDPVREMIPVRPVVHYMMGGVHTDLAGATGLPGLYAAGEVACVSINGANRLGSNSLTECLVFGARAGVAAAAFAAEARPANAALTAQAQDEQRRLEDGLLGRAGRRRADRRRSDRHADDHGGECGDLPDGGRPPRRRRRASGPCRNAGAGSRWTTAAGRSTRSSSGRSSCRSCSTSPRRSSTRPSPAANRAARTSGPTTRSATTSATWRTRSRTGPTAGHPPSGISP